MKALLLAAMWLTLPAAAQTDPADAKSAPEVLPAANVEANLGLSVHADGTVWSDGAVISTDDLPTRLKALRMARAKDQIVIQAADATPYRDVFRVVDLCYRAEFAQVKFAAEVDVAKADISPAKEEDGNLPAGEIVVNMRADGTVLVNSEALSEEQIAAKFQSIAEFNPKQAIIIRADETVQYKNMFRVLDLCYKAGLYLVSFASRHEAP